MCVDGIHPARPNRIGCQPSRLRLAAGLVNERPATSMLRRQGIAAEPVAQATRAELAGSGFGDVLNVGAAVATEGHGCAPLVARCFSAHSREQ